MVLGVPLISVFVGNYTLEKSAVLVVAKQSSLTPPGIRRLMRLEPGGQTSAGMLQNGVPGIVTLSQMRPESEL